MTGLSTGWRPSRPRTARQKVEDYILYVYSEGVASGGQRRGDGPPVAGLAVAGLVGGRHCGPGAPAAGSSRVPAEALPRALMLALRRFGPSWVRFLRGHLADPRLSPERLQLLGVLAQADEPLIMRQITTRLGTTPRAVTSLVDGLERDGLVVRTRHPTDRRAVLVGLADAGRQLLQEASQGFAEAARLFDVLDEGDQRVLLGLLGRLTAHLGGDADDPICGPPG